MKLRMLLSGARCDPGLVEITPFFKSKKDEPKHLERRVDPATGFTSDVDPETGEVFHEYLRGVTSISLTFEASGPQTSSFDDVVAWLTDHMQPGNQRPLLDV